MICSATIFYDFKHDDKEIKEDEIETSCRERDRENWP